MVTNGLVDPAPYARAARTWGCRIRPGWPAAPATEPPRRCGATGYQVAQVGEPGKDPHQTLLDIVGLHPGSAEFYQRYSQSFTQHYNALRFATEPVSAPAAAAARRYVEAGLLALADFGFTIPPGAELPDLLEKIFLRRPNLLKGELVQAELSDSAPLEITRPDGPICMAANRARTSHEDVAQEEGFRGHTRPCICANTPSIGASRCRAQVSTEASRCAKRVRPEQGPGSSRSEPDAGAAGRAYTRGARRHNDPASGSANISNTCPRGNHIKHSSPRSMC